MKLLLVPGVIALYAAMFQMPAKPPMKMGLWESETHTHMNMPNAPAMMQGMMNRTIHVKSCMTPESYEKALSAQQQQKDCKRTNEVWTDKSYAFDMSCSNGKTVGHFEMNFDSSTSAHGTVKLDMSGGRASGATSESTTDMKWVSSDCGSITPDKPEISH